MSADAGPAVGVVVPAAGSGRRMGGRKKQYLELVGIPVLLRALAPFLARTDVSAVSVALPPADAADPPGWLVDADPRIRIVAGGESRTASVRAALEALPADVDVVVVHDGARPLLAADVLDRCIAVAVDGEGAVAATPAVDTMKEVDDDGRILSTPPRSSLWHAQTPQAFPRSMLVDAYRAAEDDGAGATDDASLVERRGGSVRVVESTPRNLKVTRPEDLDRAALYLEGSRGSASVRLDVRHPPVDGETLSAVAEHLRSGGLLAYPTETVYGLGGLIRPDAIRRVLELKGRGPDRPLLLLVHDEAAVDELTWSRQARELADVFWPGAVTLVLPDPHGHFPAGVRSPEGGVAVRRTPDPVTRALLETLGEPLTSTSANAPGGEPARTADEAEAVLRELGCGAETWLLDGGELPASEPSTIIDCTGSRFRVLREGAVPASRIRCVRPEAT